jgi:hypothetical protein
LYLSRTWSSAGRDTVLKVKGCSLELSEMGIKGCVVLDDPISEGQVVDDEAIPENEV